MKIIFVKPNICDKKHYKYSPSDCMEPLSLSILAGLTPSDIEVKIFDDRIETINYDELTDMVAISVETFSAKRAYQIASEYRSRRVPVVLGGYHPTLVPDEAQKYADSIVIGEAENVWAQLIKDVQEGKLRERYKSSGPASLNCNKPNRNIYKGKKYLPIKLVQYGRGCRYSCNFCCVTAFYNHKVAFRPVKEVTAEIEQLGAKVVFFIDDNIAADMNKAKELFKELIPLKIRWVSQISLSFAADDELIELMVKSGCVGVLIGFESLNENNLRQMNKIWHAQYGSYETILRKIRNYGLIIYGTFVFGYDYDCKDTIERTLDFALRQKLFIANFNHLMPYPGTPLYEKLQSEGRLIYNKWWLDTAYRFGHVVFEPKLMTSDELTKACMAARIEFNSYYSIFYRALDFKANCRNLFNASSYFIYNIVSKNEITKKQNIILGGNSV